MDIRQHATSNYMHRGPPRPRRPLAFVQQCPMGVTPLNQALSVLSLSIGFCVCSLLFIMAIFVLLSLRLYVFCLLVVLLKLSVLSKRLAKKDSSKEGHLIVVRRLSPQSRSRRALMYFIGLVQYCFIVLLCVCLSCPQALHDIFRVAVDMNFHIHIVINNPQILRGRYPWIYPYP